MVAQILQLPSYGILRSALSAPFVRCTPVRSLVVFRGCIPNHELRKMCRLHQPCFSSIHVIHVVHSVQRIFIKERASIDNRICRLWWMVSRCDLGGRVEQMSEMPSHPKIRCEVKEHHKQTLKLLIHDEGSARSAVVVRCVELCPTLLQ